MATLTHISAHRLAPGLCLSLSGFGLLLVTHSPVLGLSLSVLGGLLALLRGPHPEASSHIGTSSWTVRFGAEVITLPLDSIAEVRIDHPHNGPDRVQVLMTDGLCLPLPDAALPKTDMLIAALEKRSVPLRLHGRKRKARRRASPDARDASREPIPQDISCQP